MIRLIPRVGLIIGKEEIEAASKRSAQNGVVAEFEGMLAEKIGIKYAYSTYSGRTALFLILKTLGLEKDDEVVIPSFVCGSVVDAILSVPARPVLADIDSISHTLNPESFQKSITPKTRVVIPVHTYGHPCDMDVINQIASEHGIFVVEDCAQALGAEYKHKPVGSLGDASIFSFAFDKNITSGIGGMLLTSNKETASLITKKLNLLKEPGAKDHRNVKRNVNKSVIMVDFRRYGLYEKISKPVLFFTYLKKRLYNNYEVPLKGIVPSAAEIGLIQMKRIDEMNEKRIGNAKKLTDGLRDISIIKLPGTKGNVRHVFLRYTVEVLGDSPIDSRRRIVKLLRHSGIEAGTFVWRSAIHQKTYYRHLLGKYEEKLPITDDFTQRLINLPVHPLLNDNDISKIVDSFKCVATGKVNYHES